MSENLELFEETMVQTEELHDEKPWEETEQSTIVDALIYLTRHLGEKRSLGNRRPMTLDRTDNAALRYLMRRLNMTYMQVHLLACILYHYQATGRDCDMDDITSYMDCHPMELLSQHEEFDKLTDMGYLEISRDHFGGGQHVELRRAVLEALGKNEPFDIETLRAVDSAAFFAKCADVIRSNARNGRDDEFPSELTWLFKINAHLPVTHNIRRIAGNDELVLKTLIVSATTLSAESSTSVDQSDFSMMMPMTDMHRVVHALQNGTHPLIEQKIMEPVCSEGGMADANEWVITKEGWMTLLSGNTEEVDAILAGNDIWGRRLTPYTKIPERQLFFSGKTQDEVNRLRQLLQDESYRQIVERLREKDMPTGLNILLYGTPGTGKTELVQQLARETGRDIFVVDMSQIRDKFVGESEHNLANIFYTYRNYVRRMKKAPILFCNECDAIFGTRMERTERSVDKMENALQNILLEQMEKMEGIMICTTNLTSTLDKAFERRFLLKVQLPKPSNEARKQIWATMLPGLSEEQTSVLANRFDFSGGQIQNVTRKQIINSIFTGTDTMDFNHILDDCQAETMDRSNGRRIGF